MKTQKIALKNLTKEELEAEFQSALKLIQKALETSVASSIQDRFKMQRNLRDFLDKYE